MNSAQIAEIEASAEIECRSDDFNATHEIRRTYDELT